MNWYKRSQNEEFYYELSLERPKMAAAAQDIYNAWDEEDFLTGGGAGICDEIAEAIGGVITMNIPDVEVREGGHDGDDHAWVIAIKNGISYGVDIPYHVYEQGGGYNWTKIPNVIFSPNHVEIWNI
jgi:hypothetical protein